MKKVLSVLATGLLSVGLVACAEVDESEKEVDKTVEKPIEQSKPIEKPKPIEQPKKEFTNIVAQQNRDEVLAIVTSHAETYWADDQGMKEYVIREQMDYYDTLSSLKIETQEEQAMLKRVFHDHAYDFIAMQSAYTEEFEKLENLD